MLLWTSAAELQDIDQVSDIQWRVEALEETQKECIQLLNEELGKNKSGVALLKKIEASFIEVDPLPTVIFFTEEIGGRGEMAWEHQNLPSPNEILSQSTSHALSQALS